MNQLVTMQLDIVRYPRYRFMGPNMTGCSIVTRLEPVLSTRRFQVKYFFVLGSIVISSITCCIIAGKRIVSFRDPQ